LTTLAIVPTYLRKVADLEMAQICLRSLKDTAPEAEILVVDDASPAMDMTAELVGDEFEVHWNEENKGFAATVNVGLSRARDEGKDAVLVNSDIEFLDYGWLEKMQEAPADVVGALLLFPHGLIQHAGIYMSVITRQIDHRYRMAPGSLDAAQERCVCPVTGALQLIRNETLKDIGIYDERFRMGYEDVSYCQDAFVGGRTCLYEPAAKAIHHESFFRQRLDKKLADWTEDSRRFLYEKHKGQSFSEFFPTMIPELDTK
jgi:GT2 family glycosyltransferase